MNSRLENGTQNTFLATLIPGERSDYKEDGQPVGGNLGWANVNLTEEVGKKK